MFDANGPVQQLREAFTPRELALIANCIEYASNKPAGLPGHNLMLVIKKFAIASHQNFVTSGVLLGTGLDEATPTALFQLAASVEGK